MPFGKMVASKALRSTFASPRPSFAADERARRDVRVVAAAGW
jgi:hypothetical protein